MELEQADLKQAPTESGAIKKEMHKATEGEHVTTYDPDIDDIKHLIQLETRYDKGWISDSKEERIRAIDWGLKVLEVQELVEHSFYLESVRDELVKIRKAIYDCLENL
jgi:hypothetical protein